MGAKYRCRLNLKDKKPYCLQRPCWYKVSHQCSGPVQAEHGYYDIHNCPAEPDTGGKPQAGKYPECQYCRDFGSIHCKRD